MLIPKQLWVKLINSGIDRKFPKEISMARSSLYNSVEAKSARSNRQKIQIKFPARLFIDGKYVKDIFPD